MAQTVDHVRLKSVRALQLMNWEICAVRVAERGASVDLVAG